MQNGKRPKELTVVLRLNYGNVGHKDSWTANQAALIQWSFNLIASPRYLLFSAH